MRSSRSRKVLAELPADASFVEFGLRVHAALERSNVNAQAPHRLKVPMDPNSPPAALGRPRVIVEVFTSPSLQSAEQLMQAHPGDQVIAAEATNPPSPESVRQLEKAGGRVLMERFAQSLPDNSVDKVFVRFPVEQGRKKDILTLAYAKRAAEMHQKLPPTSGQAAGGASAFGTIESVTELGPHALRYLTPRGEIDIVYWEPQIIDEIKQLSKLVWRDPKTNVQYHLEIIAGPQQVPRSSFPNSGWLVPKNATTVTRVLVAKKIIPASGSGAR